LHYFRVTAVNSAGLESPFSNEEMVNVNIVPAGANMVQDGIFAQGVLNWRLNLSGTAVASWQVADGIARLFITNGASSLASVQLVQGSKALIQGNQYVLEFEAWASQSRYIQVKLAENYTPFLDYSQIAPIFITPNRTRYRYVFTMQQPSDFSAVLQFNLGTSSGEVDLANVSLFNPPVGDLNLDGRVDFLDLEILSGNWMQKGSAVPGDLNNDGKVDMNDFSIFGKNLSPEHF
jgi:hypothetical protein